MQPDTRNRSRSPLRPEIHQALAKMALEHPDGTRRLRGLWALAVTGGLSEDIIQRGLVHDDPYVRAWTIQLVAEGKQPSPVTLARFAGLAHSDPSSVVRLYLASALQRLPLEVRWEVLTGLLSHAEDATDHNLPLMDWYATEPLAPRDMRPALELALAAGYPASANSRYAESRTSARSRRWPCWLSRC